MRRYVDLWIRAERFEEALEIIRCLKMLGFSSAAMELRGECIERFDELRGEAKGVGLAIYKKLVIEPSSREDLLKLLRENRGRFEVISVICRNLETALVAARDPRVDTVIIPVNPRYRFDKGVAALMRNRVELPFKYFLEDKLGFLKTASEIVKTEIVVSSAASHSLELRSPRQLASLLQVLGFNLEKALNSISHAAADLIEENLRKLSKNYVMRGVVRLG
ncbi:MAG: hypothetical protein B6U65_04040 [Candidatus Wolframiiraptor sp. EX4484-121]|nr:MAG: hypothetical protein B6U65_04040 [Candidatus Wolframiiraptor sp. EX4484-121]